MKILSDAEKALIKIMEAKYNAEDYSNYPASIDGLFNEQVNRISYSIGENITFHTDTASFEEVRTTFL